MLFFLDFSNRVGVAVLFFSLVLSKWLAAIGIGGMSSDCVWRGWSGVERSDSGKHRRCADDLRSETQGPGRLKCGVFLYTILLLAAHKIKPACRERKKSEPFGI